MFLSYPYIYTVHSRKQGKGERLYSRYALLLFLVLNLQRDDMIVGHFLYSFMGIV